MYPGKIGNGETSSLGVRVSGASPKAEAIQRFSQETANARPSARQPGVSESFAEMADREEDCTPSDTTSEDRESARTQLMRIRKETRFRANSHSTMTYSESNLGRTVIPIDRALRDSFATQARQKGARHPA
jgi:hypothetical protein